MFLGELIFSNAADVYTPSAPAGGTKGIFTVEVTQVEGTSPTLAISIETKNRDSTDWTTAAVAFSTTITDTGVYSQEADLLEEVRLKYDAGGTNAWMRLQTYDPQYSN